MTFKHSILFATPFGCKLWLLSIQNHARDHSQSFCAPPSKVAVLFEWNLSRCPFLGHVVYLDLLQRCIAQASFRNMRFCSYALFFIRDQWILARLKEAMSATLVHRKLHFTWKKICRLWLVTARNLQAISNSVSIARLVARFPQASQRRLPPTRKCPVFVLTRAIRPSWAGARPQELGHWFCGQNLRLSSREWLPDDR